MDVTIIIVNWNGGEMLIRCLQSIRESRTPYQVKVIVVDNDSKDGSRELAAKTFPEFHVFNSGSNLGFGRANNLAKPMVDTPLVLFLNPDTEIKVNTLEQAIDCLKAHPDVGALGCKMFYPTGQLQKQGLQWHPTPWTVFLENLLITKGSLKKFDRWLPLFDPEKSAYVQKLYGGFVLARKDVLDKAGWFDDRYFMYAEDVDLSKTIMALGWKLYYCTEAEIMHVAGGTSDQAPSGFSILMKNESINKLIKKYQGGFGGILHRLAVFSGASIRLLVLLLLRVVTVGEARVRRWRGSFFKYWLSILWSLGLKKPFVATSRS